MEMEPFTNPWMKKIRVLTNLLIVSIACNIGLTTYLLFRKVGSDQIQVVTKRQIELEETNGEVLKTFFALSMGELLSQLREKNLLEDGYTKRDLALACLVNYHYFDINRAVSGVKLQKRMLTFVHKKGGETFHLEVFPGLTDEHFSMIIHFGEREKWPLTPEGLFMTMQKMSSIPESLSAAFFATPEFYALYSLFNRGKEKINAKDLLSLFLETSWSSLITLLEKQEGGFEETRSYLSEAIDQKSKKAASIWIELDSEYLHRRLDDNKLHAILELAQENTPPIHVFLKQLLYGVRSDQIRKEAAYKLYHFEGESPPEPYDHKEALKKFIPAMLPSASEEKALALPLKKKYKVEEGDSLWKIAKKHKVNIEDLRKENGLKTDQLRKGQELIIP